jgi:hypothetical protein
MVALSYGVKQSGHEADHLNLMPMLKCVELYLHSPYIFMVSYLSTSHGFTLSGVLHAQHEEQLMDWFFCLSPRFHSRTAGQIWMKFGMDFMPFECTLKWYLPTRWGRDPLVGRSTKNDGGGVWSGVSRVQWIDCGEQTPVWGRSPLVGRSPKQRRRWGAPQKPQWCTVAWQGVADQLLGGSPHVVHTPWMGQSPTRGVEHPTLTARLLWTGRAPLVEQSPQEWWGGFCCRSLTIRVKLHERQTFLMGHSPPAGVENPSGLGQIRLCYGGLG